ncbi:hypothetical protein KSF78_0005972 [Schistosoma japonicum]|nr:hypothetical protein KSF78_0005972 [Schistosoma japonicum]
MVIASNYHLGPVHINVESDKDVIVKFNEMDIINIEFV